MGFLSGQEITTSAKSVTIFLPLHVVLDSYRDIDPVMLGVKHAIIEKILSDKYVYRAAAAVAGKFNIEHLFVWMLKVEPSLTVQT